MSANSSPTPTLYGQAVWGSPGNNNTIFQPAKEWTALFLGNLPSAFSSLTSLYHPAYSPYNNVLTPLSNPTFQPLDNLNHHTDLSGWGNNNPFPVVHNIPYNLPHLDTHWVTPQQSLPNLNTPDLSMMATSSTMPHGMPHSHDFQSAVYHPPYSPRIQATDIGLYSSNPNLPELQHLNSTSSPWPTQPNLYADHASLSRDPLEPLVQAQARYLMHQQQQIDPLVQAQANYLMKQQLASSSNPWNITNLTWPVNHFETSSQLAYTPPISAYPIYPPFTGEQSTGMNSSNPPIDQPQLTFPKAYSNWLDGQGQPYRIPMSSIDFKASLPHLTSQPKFQAALKKALQSPGKAVPLESITELTAKISTSKWGNFDIYGDVAVNIKGNIVANTKTKIWHFYGQLSPSHRPSDVFDFNPGHRSLYIETGVKVFHKLSGTSFNIYMTGSAPYDITGSF